MSVRGIGDAFAFQRLLWLLVGTVIVPTVLLTLYGVMAIRNQQAAIEEQVRKQQDVRLQFGATELYDQIARTDAQVHQILPTCEGRCAPRAGAARIWSWTTEVPAELRDLPLPAPLEGETIWFSPPDGTAAIGLITLGDRRGAWQLDPDHLGGVLEASGSEKFPDGVVFRLRKVVVGTATSAAELFKRWEGTGFEATAPLERPLGGWEIVVNYPDNDPVRDILGPTRWLYPLGLVALVATVMAGTVITLNSAAREIQLSRLQTDFVSSVSHELRTPLTSIRLFVDTLQSGRLKDPERVQECLDLLSQETDRLSRLIERVLSWARMEAGRRQYETRPVPVRELVNDAISALRSQTLMEPTEAIEVDIVEAGVIVDRDAIVEALVNLLQNAVKYTPAPRVIRVTTSRGRGTVGIAVSDNGPGIQPADRKRIFEKFYQADSRLSSPTRRGSGLGLSIVRAVVRGHGGHVELQSEVGKGSVFTLWLPAD